jgi:hypothetical protein
MERMTQQVTVAETIKYGLDLIGYVIVFSVLAGFFYGFGWFFLDGSPTFALVSYAAGTIVGTAGFLGIFYKVIADGVAVGMSQSEETDYGNVTDTEDTDGVETGA